MMEVFNNRVDELVDWSCLSHMRILAGGQVLADIDLHMPLVFVEFWHVRVKVLYGHAFKEETCAKEKH